MKRLRILAAATLLGSAFTVVTATPARANCIGEPVDPCAAVCQIGLGNKYTHDLFAFCYVW